MRKTWIALLIILNLFTVQAALPNLDEGTTVRPTLEKSQPLVGPVINTPIYLNAPTYVNNELNVYNNLNVHGSIFLINNNPQPSCNSQRRGQLFFLRGALGVADSLQICVKNVLDAYLWLEINLV